MAKIETTECPNCHELVLKAKHCSECGVNLEQKKFEDVTEENKKLKARQIELEKELDDEKKKTAGIPATPITGDDGKPKPGGKGKAGPISGAFSS